MQKIKLNNQMEYEVITCGASRTDLVIELPKEGNDLADLASIFSDADNTCEINLYDEEGTLVRTPYIGYTDFFKVELHKAEPQIESIDRFEIVLNYAEPQYATQEDMEMVMDAIADMSEIVYA